MSLVLVFLPGAFAAPVGGRLTRFSLTLARAEALAREHSLELKTAAEQSAAAWDEADAQWSTLLPRLTLDGVYRYQTVPFAAPTTFAADRSSALGPTLTWTLWDTGALRSTWKAQQASARSYDDRRRLAQTRVVLGARLAYFQVVLAREQVRLLAESVGVAAAQYEDILKRFEAGAASRIDVLQAHQEELQRRKDFFNAQAGLGAALRELFQLVGETRRIDLARPVDARLGFSLPAALPPPTLLVEVEPLTRVSAELLGAADATWDRAHPELLALTHEAESARLAARSAAQSRWPKVQVQALADYEYPRAQSATSVMQKAVALTASVPLFDGRQLKSQEDAQGHLAAAADRRRDLAAEQLARDWDRLQLRLRLLRDEQNLDDKRVAESGELAQLVYVSYTSGRSTYIDVQVANLGALQAKIQAAQTRAQVLIQLAQLAQLAGQA